MLDLDDDEILDFEEGWPPDHDDQGRFDPPICRSVHGAYHALMRGLSARTREHGLDPSEALVLAWLRRSPGCAPSVVRHALGFHRSTLSSVLNRLERDGLIFRVGAAYGGRRLELNLTDAGTHTAELADAVIHDVEANLAEYTSRSQRRGAEAVFAACVAIAPGDSPPDV
jgi:DNA-binding MarR family transcriptional regulator